jgi:hypothetical protein
MSVDKMSFKIYDSQGTRPRQKAFAKTGFDEAIKNAVEKSTNENQACCCNGLRCTPVTHKIITDEAGKKTSDEAGADETNANQSQESSGVIKNTENESLNSTEATEVQYIESSVSYSFSIFIRTSSRVMSYGENLLNQFKKATEDFVKSLEQSDKHQVGMLDAYLGQAQSVANQGQSQTLEFIDEILQAADNGLQAVTASLEASGKMNSLNGLNSPGGFNLSMNSAMPGTSAADIAALHLQQASKYTGVNQISKTGLTEKRGYELKLIRGEDIVSEQQKNLNMVDETITSDKSKILHRFLSLLEDMKMRQGSQYLSDEQIDI